ncbi:MAG: sigma-54 dependent transcriptional regulator [Bacteroidetes bacterium]|nr:sigma-54 dependent transcriptional regulator [Bacteroidota bacterium]
MEERTSLISENLAGRIDRHLIGVSPQILKVLDFAMTAARFPDTNVLITGESGTGKENIARIIHFASIRKDNILCTVNSSSVTDSLMESEFFGHKKGSFTGAGSDKKGFFEFCDHGTLFLDEIADMPLNLQAKVLRAIEEKKITRVGDTDQISVDFRIISATNHLLESLVEQKQFRLDLLHRLNTLNINIPPLRERPDDIEPELMKYSFPGNIRELRNMAERAVILSEGDSLGIRDFPIKLSGTHADGTEVKRLNLPMHETEMISQALKASGFNQKHAAGLLGISRDALIRKMRKYNIHIVKDDIRS